MNEEETLTLSMTVVVTPEPEWTAQDKEAVLKQVILDQLSVLAGCYDWGIAVNGTLESTCSETAVLDDSKPVYTEE